ncbi:MAG: hypothetical protein Q4A90_06720 [Streptococcus sp.]|nr:hypothetical protein [Streptococcus sp.]
MSYFISPSNNSTCYWNEGDVIVLFKNVAGHESHLLRGGDGCATTYLGNSSFCRKRRSGALRM